ncbi:unnamed protein product [Didymodactylos carnosus]|uniref:FAD-binding domain-containing protein n=1 Tax=Didymodactylos carnosus TaxID=1234261 RepID=A0A813Z9H0_9BILA|nr:unnamed protein product [Didymodactylos carnosus]CAF0895488.1 unnamed protein product [Didymodactylos carnosus]CAF3606429.1 unnamed protein product [Didymodactylos carnosus]CAF3678851.1 unnamed protein product [Didymodactylos carnosus]
MDSKFDCTDGSDESLHYRCESVSPLGCKLLRDADASSMSTSNVISFRELCDGIVDKFFLTTNSSETDETDCEHWGYTCEDSLYTKCDQRWHCPDGRDELNCPWEATYATRIQQQLNCSRTEHYCVQLLGATCLSLARAGDGVIDCLGATDERRTANKCYEKHPFLPDKRFLCANTIGDSPPVCLTPEQVCDGQVQCPAGDDERFCYHPRCPRYHPNVDFRFENALFCDLTDRKTVENILPMSEIGNYLPTVVVEGKVLSSVEGKALSSVKGKGLSSIEEKFRLWYFDDAAHIMPPSDAKGMNIAISDAKVLATLLPLI